MTANERRMRILKILLNKRNVTMLELQKEFHISRSTVRRDIENLSLSHPIMTAKGGGGGVFVMEGYKLGMIYFTDEQTALLEKLSKSLIPEDLAIMNSILKTFKKPASVR